VLQIVCYNADNLRNKLFLKGLHVTRTRLFRNLRLICALLVTAVFGLHAELYAQTAAAPKAPASRQASGTPSGSGTSARLQLPAKKAPAKAKTTSTSAARARRARLARARAAAAAKALKEAQEPPFKLDANGALVPDIRAEAAIIYNPQTGQVLWESNSQDQRSIASITKVMTAAVFLENSPDLSREVVVQAADVRRASTTYLRAGYKISTDNLLHLLLIGSDNAAARVLARVSPHGSEGFIARMNDKALELGLTSTHYADPSGLLASNVSSAYDMARLIAYVSGDQRISEIMRTASYSVAVGRRSITVNSTNQLVRQGDVDVVGGKTGFISRAGYCLATLLRLPQGGPQVAVVVLGAKSNAGRFWETRHLFNWLSTKAKDLIGGIPVEAAAVAN
jgi:serine-type D-Ala-D-Ala endopeptidase (penicillin-binding protein 7)